jgi:hypothetical protein
VAWRRGMERVWMRVGEGEEDGPKERKGAPRREGRGRIEAQRVEKERRA